MSSSRKSTHDYFRKHQRAILEPWIQSHNLPPSPLPNRNTHASPTTTNSSPSLSPPQNPSPNQIAHKLHHLSNLLEINLQQAIDATNPSPPTSPCIPLPSLDKVNLHSESWVDFRIWQKKMHFLRSSMSVVYVLTTPIPVMVNVESSKELWDSLEAKYMAEDASSKKFLVSNFINYKLIDSRPVLEQYNELLDFKHTLKHLKEELTLVELDSHLRIEESLRVQDSDKPKGKNVAGPLVVNMVEHKNSFRYNDNKGKCKHHDNTRADPNKKAKPTCWKCGKTGHIKRDCKGVNVGNKANGSGTKSSVDGLSNSLKGETIHVCKDRCWFKTYDLLNGGSILHMVNESIALVHGRSCVDLRLNIVNDSIASTFMSTCKLNDSIIWHARLGHVHFKRMQDMSKDRVWGCTTVGRLPDPKLKTLGERGIERIFIGYAEHSKASRFYVIEPNDLVSINSIIELKDAIFDKNRFFPRPSLRIPNGTEGISSLVVLEEVTEEKEAINDEMDSIMGNNTWVLADVPPGCKPLHCKWIFKRKLKVDVNIEKFKARLVIQGFKQKSGIDYFDTYAPVACISNIRLLIAMASIHNLIIHLMEVKTTFLNGELDEEVYMNQPQDFIMPSNENKVDLTKKFLSSRFSMKDMGEADVILGIRTKHESNGIEISQSHYIKKVLKKFNYFDCTLVSTPMDASEKLMPNKGHTISQLEYSRMIGCLMYAMTCTRHDTAFVADKLSWYILVILASKKQTCITDSTMEYEFVALAAAGKEAKCQMDNGKSRHLGIRHSMIRELITNGVISIEFVRTPNSLLRKLGSCVQCGKLNVQRTKAHAFTYHLKDVLGNC
ncbi:zinc finger, CCHC-type containing protein [Tanacetum coccineum]